MWRFIILSSSFLVLQVLANPNQKLLQIPTSCAEIMDNTTAKDGVYLISIPSSELPPFNVYCDNSGWTIIQRRSDGRENFYRNWYDYKHGFGDLYGEYWLGLQRLHELTRDRPHQLWVRLVAFDYSRTDAFYSKFYVADEDEAYKLTVGDYQGDAGDALAFHNGFKFSTYDNNNSASRQNCPVERLGAFWYFGCAYANLNGIYRQNPSRDVIPNIYWRSWRDYESMKYVHMAVRPL